jgi:hypothetical protein
LRSKLLLADLLILNVVRASHDHNNAPYGLVACPVESGVSSHTGTPLCRFHQVPFQTSSLLQSRGHIDCSVVDVRTPCERVELDVVVDDLSAGVGGIHQVEALHLISALA